MEPVKRDGKIREQVEIEKKVRREYCRKWQQLADKELNEFYNQSKCNEELQQKYKQETEICPYNYTGHGDSYFVSQGMYDSLVGICRCGRKKSEGHVLKCLQKVKNKYLIGDTSDEQIQANRSRQKFEDGADEGDNRYVEQIPKTSSGIIGWPKHSFLKWEKSTYYISPKYTMPGHRVDDHPYSNIFIG